jgi:hypothetical protein
MKHLEIADAISYRHSPQRELEVGMVVLTLGFAAPFALARSLANFIIAN